MNTPISKKIKGNAKIIINKKCFIFPSFYLNINKNVIYLD